LLEKRCIVPQMPPRDRPTHKDRCHSALKQIAALRATVDTLIGELARQRAISEEHARRLIDLDEDVGELQRGQTAPDIDGLVNLKQAAALVGYDRESVRRWARDGISITSGAVRHISFRCRACGHTWRGCGGEGLRFCGSESTERSM
jgi:hypothetical protein